MLRLFKIFLFLIVTNSLAFECYNENCYKILNKDLQFIDAFDGCRSNDGSVISLDIHEHETYLKRKFYLLNWYFYNHAKKCIFELSILEKLPPNISYCVGLYYKNGQFFILNEDNLEDVKLLCKPFRIKNHTYWSRLDFKWPIERGILCCYNILSWY